MLREHRLAEQDEGILAYVEDDPGVPYQQLREELAAQTKRALVHPVFFGSARTGAGVEQLMAGIAELLPASEGDPDAPVSGTVFKIERGPSGEKLAYVRMFSGTVRTRDRLPFGPAREDKVTAIAVFERGPAVQRPSVSAGAVAKFSGLNEIQIGDRIGETGTKGAHEFPPLINVRQDDRRQELSVSLYGEVQKEVIQATLASDFGLEVGFRETTSIHIERPIGTGEAVEFLQAESNPFLATVGLRIDRAPNGSGIDFRLQVDPRSLPLYLYKTAESFTQSMGQYVRQTLVEGLFGWQVTDCVVTMTECTYSVPDGPPSRRGPLSTAADFRKLTPIVVMRALEQAGSVVCEPIVRVSLEIPTDTIGAVVTVLARLGAAVETPALKGNLCAIETVLSAAGAHVLQRRLPGLTRGEGMLESSFEGYEPVSGEQPSRSRTTPNPLNLAEYTMNLAGRAIPPAT